MKSRRQRRVGELLRETLSNLIEYELSDPRLGMITVTGVEVAPDLKHAHVHVSLMGGDASPEQVLRVLEGARGHIRRQLAARVDLKFTPDLSFHLDRSLERGQRILDLIQRIREERQG